jgi:peptidyl-prolyl cis-trans isomerase SurA
VENFYQTYEYSIPDMPKRVNISHIFLKVRPASSSDSAAVSQLREIKDMLQAGANFSELAAEYSQDPGSRQTGGDLGFVSRGSLVPEFEEVAFALEPGELSRIVKTDFGYHLIKLEERRGEKIHVRHILLTPEATESDIQSVRDELNALRTEVIQGAAFDSLAQEVSDDADVTLNKGNLGWFEVPNLQLPEFRQVVDTMEVGDISQPFQTELGWHVMKLNDMRPAGEVTLEDNWAEIEQMVIQQKRAEEYQTWLDNIRSQFYVDVKVSQNPATM